MSDQELNHLIKMINQIANNVAGRDDDDRIRNTAVHIEKFWAPSMRNKISSHSESSPEDLHPAAVQALELLR
jgi:formate dehydrogenase subunit delta